MLGDIIKNMTMTVEQLNDYAAGLLEKDSLLQGLLVAGEISNFKLHSSGHMYFTLKDEKAAIRCVMFRQHAQGVGFKPDNGSKVTVGGYVSLYRKEGQFQIYAQSMQLEGVGQLYERFEKLKRQLEKEGLFDSGHKKQLPRFPRRIGVATSRTGAVIRDIINVSTRRNPSVDLLLYPVAVQGSGAEQEIATAIEYFNGIEDIDVIIIGRGGGSMEDLWPFNEELLARAVYASEKPVISAVGHETDYCITDFVADLRAPTPSAAAELAVPLRDEALLYVDGLAAQMKRVLEDSIERSGNRVDMLIKSPRFTGLLHRMDAGLQKVDYIAQAMRANMSNRADALAARLQLLGKQLEAASPAAAMEKGYSIVYDEDTGQIMRCARDITMGQQAIVRFADGNAQAVFTGQVELKRM